MGHPAQLLDHNGRIPSPSASHGRHVRRSGATMQGHLSNWVNQVVGARVAEREKRIISDRAQDLYVNSAIASGLIDGMVTEIVGTGLTPQPNPMSEYLGHGRSWDQKWTDAAMALYELWGFDPRHWCDAQRRMNAYQQQAWACFSWKLDGIGLFQVQMRSVRGAASRLCLLPIDSTRLQTPTTTRGLTNRPDIYDGVEIDKHGAPVAVHIAKPTPANYARATATDTQRIPVNHTATGLPQVLMVCDVRNVAEYKQDSVLSAVVGEIKTNDDLVEAALIRTMMLNLFTLYVSQETPSGGLMGAASQDSDNQIDWTDRTQEFPKGMIIEGPKDYKPESLDSNAPGPGFSDMWRSGISRVGIATQRGSENLLREYNSSYSASQVSIENAEAVSAVDRGTLNSSFNNPVWSWLCYPGALEGRLPLPRGVSPSQLLGQLHAYTRADWLPPPLRVIDKLKAAKSDNQRLADNTTTYAKIYGERGQNWRRQLKQRAAELKYRKELEIEFGVDLAPQDADSPVSAAPEQPEQPDNPGGEP